MADPFHVRFNINVNLKEAQQRFIHRIESSVLILTRQFYNEPVRDHDLDTIMIKVDIELGEQHVETTTFPHDFIKVWRSRVSSNFSRCLHATEGFYRSLAANYPKYRRQLNEMVKSTISQSEVDLGISWQDGIFTKTGAKLLDEQLVNEPLRWLADPAYQNVLTPFEKGLRHFLEGTKEAERLADAVTDMYEATEALAKIVTGKPAKDLAGLREEFISKLKLPDAYKRMLKEYIDYGCDFRHAVEQGKPRSWPAPHEAEAFVYSTGLFIRLAIESTKTNQG